jgi:RluA family pseudouridine synthase
LREYTRSCEVDPYRSGWTLREFLCHRFRYRPWEVWAVRIARGALAVNGVTAAAETVVRKGDRVTYSFEHEEPEVDRRIAVLHEDEEVLVVDKPGNLPVHAGGAYISNTLIAILRERWGADLRPAHRLDRDTSGVVVLAKSADAARHLEREFRKRRVAKTYAALLEGRLGAEVQVDARVARADGGRTSRRMVDASGQPARTHFVPLGYSEPSEGPVRTLVRVVPESGRTHQIRVHAAHLGHPVAGDRLYGPPDGVPHPASHLLHCARVRVAHPSGRGMLCVQASIPDRFRVFWYGVLPWNDKVPAGGAGKSSTEGGRASRHAKESGL